MKYGRTMTVIVSAVVMLALGGFLYYYISQNYGNQTRNNSNEEVIQINNTNSVDPFLMLYENAEKVCVQSGGIYAQCPPCDDDTTCPCSPCSCPEGYFIDYAVGCRKSSR